MAHRNQRRQKAEGRADDQKFSRSASLTRRPQTTAATRSGRVLRCVKSFLIAASVIGSIAGGYAIIRPDLAVEPDVYLNEKEPFSMQFKVTNSGLLPLYDMTFSCLVDTRHIRNNWFANFPNGQTPISRLSSKESTTTSCPAVFGFHPFPSDTQIIVSARAPGWWGRRTWRTRFVSRPDARGVFRWLHQSVDNEKSPLPAA